MSREQLSHPKPEQLTAFALGQLDALEAAAVKSHVAECDACSQAVKAAQADTFVPGTDTVPPPCDDAPKGGAPPGSTSMNQTTLLPSDVSEQKQSGSAAGAQKDQTLFDPELAGHPRYEILGLLGRGGMGAVYKARHRLMQRTVALKVIDKQFTGNPRAVVRFHREVQAAARLTHPNIVTAHDAEQAGNVHFMIMEFVEGVNLATHIKQNGRLPVERACDCVRQIALGLQHAFEQGMVHRDIKPQNLMLTPDGRIKILDFGLAHFASEAATRSGLTEFGSIIGTPDYMAPEQARDAHAADIRADIYSLGCTFFHLLSGEMPFPKGTIVEKVMAHTERQPPPISQFRDDVPQPVTEVLRRMMAKNPADRFATPADVAEALFRAQHSSADRPESLDGVDISQSTDVLPQAVLDGIFEDDGLDGDDAEPAAEAEQAGVVLRFQEHTGPVFGLAFSPDRHHALSAGGDLVLRLWNLRTGQEVKHFTGHDECVRAVAFLPDGSHVASAGDDATVRLWASRSAREVRRFEGHSGPVYCLAVSSDSRYLLSGGEDAVLRVWEIETGREAGRLVGPRQPIRTVAFSHSGRLVLAAGDETRLYLWDLKSKAGRKCRGHSRPLLAAAFSPDGRSVCSAARDSTLRQWQVKNGEQLRCLEEVMPSAECVAFSPNTRRALAGGDDGLLTLWNLETGGELERFEGQKTRIRSIVFSQDARNALTAGDDGCVVLWRLGSE